MRQISRILVTGSVLALLVAGGPASAASPNSARQLSISVAVANGFVPVSETATGQGTVVATFKSPTATVKALGQPGSTISFFPDPSTAATSNSPAHGGLAVEMRQPARPKTTADANAYRDSGRTVVGDLVALGMPRADAEREFGDMETMDGTNPYTAAVADTSAAPGGGSPASTPNAVLTSASVPTKSSSNAILATSTTTPYATECYNASAASGKISGYGCSTYYLISQNGNDWWFNDKFKFSAHSTDTSLFPVRLKQVAWKVSWSTNNVVYDWDPASTHSVGSCATLTMSASSGTVPSVGISISGTVCPNSLGLWTISSRVSGAIWNGAEQGTDYDAAIGVQSVHNPPTAAASYWSNWYLAW